MHNIYNQTPGATEKPDVPEELVKRVSGKQATTPYEPTAITRTPTGQLGTPQKQNRAGPAMNNGKQLPPRSGPALLAQGTARGQVSSKSQARAPAVTGAASTLNQN